MSDQQPAQKGPLTPGDLVELMTSFNEVTSKLESTHKHLRSEVRRLRAELREANSELERSRRLAALGEMAAGIAHEIRNPLGSIGLYARILTEDLGELPDSKRSAVKITDAVRRLDAIVSDVLTFSREMRLGAERADVAMLIDEAIESTRPTRERSGLALEVRKMIDPEAIEAGVWCDETLVHQALVNVIENAIQAMEERGETGTLGIHVGVGSLRDRDGKRCRGVTIAVSDTGPGIPQEVVERMFNPFFTTRSAGTGLGLAIVHRIVDAHGGRVTVRNAAGDRASDATPETAAQQAVGVAGRGASVTGATIEISFPDRSQTGRAFAAAGPESAAQTDETTATTTDKHQAMESAA